MKKGFLLGNVSSASGLNRRQRRSAERGRREQEPSPGVVTAEAADLWCLLFVVVCTYSGSCTDQCLGSCCYVFLVSWDARHRHSL